jgi:hypothetical protein
MMSLNASLTYRRHLGGLRTCVPKTDVAPIDELHKSKKYPIGLTLATHGRAKVEPKVQQVIENSVRSDIAIPTVLRYSILN